MGFDFLVGIHQVVELDADGEDFGIGEAAAVPKMHQPLAGNGDLLFEIGGVCVSWFLHGFYFGFFPSFFLSPPRGETTSGALRVFRVLIWGF